MNEHRFVSVFSKLSPAISDRWIVRNVLLVRSAVFTLVYVPPYEQLHTWITTRESVVLYVFVFCM
jgi:hypothetical protein